jgi:hypothetical protein
MRARHLRQRRRIVSPVRRTGKKCEGRKSYAERDPALVKAARELRAESPRMSLRKLAAALNEQGFVTRRGLRYSASAIQSMLGE